MLKRKPLSKLDHQSAVRTQERERHRATLRSSHLENLVQQQKEKMIQRGLLIRSVKQKLLDNFHKEETKKGVFRRVHGGVVSHLGTRISKKRIEAIESPGRLSVNSQEEQKWTLSKKSGRPVFALKTNKKARILKRKRPKNAPISCPPPCKMNCHLSYHIGGSAFQVYSKDSATFYEEKVTEEDREVDAILTGVPLAGEYVRQLYGKPEYQLL